MSQVVPSQKDCLKFQSEKCSKCPAGEHCFGHGDIKQEDVRHWIGSCPQYFNWVHNYTNWFIEQLQWEREHPEEVEKRHQENIKKWNAQRKLKSQTTKSSSESSQTK